MKRLALIIGLSVVPLLGAEESGAPRLDLEAMSELDEAEVLDDRTAPPAPDFGDRALSASRQFGVTGGTPAQRASLVLLADDVRRRFHRLLDEPEGEPQMAIEIILHGEVGGEPRARPLAFELRETRDTFMLRMHVDLAHGIDQDRLETGLRIALIYERSLSAIEPGDLNAPLRAPLWLVVGLREADAWQRGEAERRLYEGVFRHGGDFSMDDLFSIRESAYWRLDGVSRAMFQVHSGALVMALLEQPGGRENFREFCTEVARFEGETPILLRQYFPDLNLSENSLRKWWALTLAKLSEAPLTEVLGVRETERALDEALHLRVRDADGALQVLALDDLAGNEALEDRDPAARFALVRPVQDTLNRLSYRCFPSYRPLLRDYQEILVRWARGGFDADLAVEIDELAAFRGRMHERALRARDYLDFTEISRAAELSGSFDDFIRLKEEIERQPRTRRDDPVSNYLDTFQRSYEARER
jgi:hypothetical protein